MIKIPTANVPQGVAEVTLFKENGLPVAERLFFVKQDQKLRIQTELNKTEFRTRDKANLKIKVTDENGQGVVAHLGLSVYDAIYQNKQDVKNIQTHYLLSTQLKGNLYNPTYYFNQKNIDRNEALDLVLLTHGWRNYVWNEDNLKEQNGNTKVVFDSITGKVILEKPTKKSVTNDFNPKALAVFSADESKGKEFMMTDAEGLFTIGPKDLKKGAGGYTYIQLLTPKKPKYTIQIKDDSFTKINREKNNKTFIYPLPAIKKMKQEETSPFVGRLAINKLKEVVIMSKNNGQALRDKYIGKLFNLDYVCEHNILNCRNHPYSEKKPVEGKKYNIMQYNGSIYQTVPIIYKYKSYTESELLESFNLLMFPGYYGKKIFYEAVYDEVTLQDSTPDYRNTLFWKSDIITDKNGDAKVDFFCSDINSLFIGTIEGVNDYGLLGSENFEFKVRKAEK